MTIQGEQTSPGLIRPDLDLVVIRTRDEQWLGLVEVNATDGTIVLFEAVYQGTHAVIP